MFLLVFSCFNYSYKCNWQLYFQYSWSLDSCFMSILLTASWHFDFSPNLYLIRSLEQELQLIMFFPMLIINRALIPMGVRSLCIKKWAAYCDSVNTGGSTLRVAVFMLLPTTIDSSTKSLVSKLIWVERGDFQMFCRKLFRSYSKTVLM